MKRIEKVNQDIDISAYIKVGQRRWLPMVIVVTLMFALVSVITYVLPAVYRAEARILVESQRIPTGLAQATVTAQTTERIQVITQRLMTRENLLTIAREFSLFPKERFNLSPTEIVDVMREATQIRPSSQINTSRRGLTQVIAFTVAFEYQQPAAAARVANRFVELILEQNLRTRTRRASDTRNFFERQLRNRTTQLDQLKTEIVDYKNKNRNFLPESLDYRRNLLSASQREIAEIDLKIEALSQERELVIARARAGSPVLSGDAPGPRQRELEKLNVQLVQLLTLYSDSHPNVRKVKAQISAMEKASELSISSEQTAALENEAAAQPNPETDPAVAFQLSLIQRQGDALRERRIALESRVGTLNQSIARAPEIEVKLSGLLNERRTLEEEVRQLKAKTNLADIGEQLEEGRQAERFEVIEQATSPAQPIKPERLKILLAGSFVSVAAGLGFIILLELMDQTVRGRAELTKRLGVQPITTVPYIYTTAERRFRKRKRIGLVLLIFTAAVAGLLAMHFFVRPLDILLLRAMIEIKQFLP